MLQPTHGRRSMRLEILIRSFAIAAVFGHGPSAFAKGKKPKAAAESSGKKSAPNPKALADLAGKFKWGMTPDDIQKVIGESINAKYQDQITKETDVYSQDQLRKQRDEEVAK